MSDGLRARTYRCCRPQSVIPTKESWITLSAASKAPRPASIPLTRAAVRYALSRSRIATFAGIPSNWSRRHRSLIPRPPTVCVQPKTMRIIKDCRAELGVVTALCRRQRVASEPSHPLDQPRTVRLMVNHIEISPAAKQTLNGRFIYRRREIYVVVKDTRPIESAVPCQRQRSTCIGVQSLPMQILDLKLRLLEYILPSGEHQA